jgi:uncharacterized lipoprotein NlpE involved in copper resistance
MNGRIVCTALVMTLALMGCKSQEEAPSGETPATEAPAAEAPEAQAPAAEGAETPEAAQATATEEATAAAAADAPATDPAESARREKLARAYMDVYCAHRTGQTEKLLEAYQKHGFQDPKTWTRAWIKASEDAAWVAKLTHDAMTAECP